MAGLDGRFRWPGLGGRLSLFGIRDAGPQFNRNRAIPGCFKGADAVTWHGDYDRHYGWCVAATEDAARAALSYRDDKLRGCSRRAYGHE
jgi:hypothetical protein